MKPLVSFGSEGKTGRFSRLPMDSFYWRYEEGGRCVDIGCYRHRGAWHFSTAEIVDKGYESLNAEGIAEVLGELMLERVSGWFGGRRIVLVTDEAFPFQREQIEAVSQMLAPLGFVPSERYARHEILWTRGFGGCPLCRMWRGLMRS